MEFDYSFLISCINKKYNLPTLNRNIESFCKEVGMFTSYRFKRILNNKANFNNADIVKIASVLLLDNTDIINCFFITKEVVK